MSEFKVRPLNDFVVVVRASTQEQTEGGIIVPNQAQLPSHEGKVEAVGPGVYLNDGGQVPMEVKEGDIVVFPRHAGSDIEIFGRFYTVMHQTEIWFVLEEAGDA